MTQNRNRAARRTRVTQNVVVGTAILASAGMAGALIGQATASVTATQTTPATSSNHTTKAKPSFRGTVTSRSNTHQQPQATTQGS